MWFVSAFDCWHSHKIKRSELLPCADSFKKTGLVNIHLFFQYGLSGGSASSRSNTSCSVATFISVINQPSNIAVNATVRGNSSRALQYLLFAAHVALPPALGR